MELEDGQVSGMLERALRARTWRLWIGCVGMAGILWGGGTYLSRRASDPAKIEELALTRIEASQSDSASPAIPVRVSTTRYGTLPIRLDVVGHARARRIARIRSEIGGRIVRCDVRPGTRVAAGDVLARFDEEYLQLELELKRATWLEKLANYHILDERPEARVIPSQGIARDEEERLRRAEESWRAGTLADTEFERMEREFELGRIASGASREEVLAAVTGLREAELAYRRARLQYARTKILAPFPGIVTEVRVTEGQECANGEEIMTMMDPDSIEVEAEILESYLAKVRPGQEVHIDIGGEDGGQCAGRIRSVSPTIDLDRRICIAYIVPSAPCPLLRDGAHCDVWIIVEVHKNRLLVPKSAVLTRMGRKLCFTVKEGRARWTYVETGLENEDFVDIVHGLEPGDEVITDGHFAMADGVPVVVREK